MSILYKCREIDFFVIFIDTRKACIDEVVKKLLEVKNEKKVVGLEKSARNNDAQEPG